MPEYRRFISYFYEYIEGKKQRNTGFAKVELRNGIWRVLFRLTVSVQPDPPVEVFGFIREGEKLTGLPMGTMRAGKEMMEEWAYRAGEPVWLGKYGMSDISGLWIQSGDGRCFATVWDDEPVDPARFMKYEAQDEEQAGSTEGMSGQEDEKEAADRAGDREEVAEKPARPNDMPGWPGNMNDAPEQPENEKEAADGPEGREEVPEKPARPNDMSGWPGNMNDAPERLKDKEEKTDWTEAREEVPEKPARPNDVPDWPGNMNDAPERLKDKEEKTDWAEAREEVPEKPARPNDVPGWPGNMNDAPEQPENEKEAAGRSEGREETPEQLGNPRIQSADTEMETADDGLWRELYGKRVRFQPFSDQEISSCIRVFPGDIVLLQNAHWRTGKNNFLLHGYHNYRHLLIGRKSDGQYVLGVPGIMNPQEKYMASMFGFPDFKYADSQNAGAPFGYWYRPLKKEDR